ncbi:MAG: Eco57I restriction-modification methylase domain-containing protein [Ignavibacteria bacterium]|nr:Eco57I restriction-modification methylase domain-containing protein [Ignavibacteria bacterium]
MDSISEFLDTALKNTLSDVNIKFKKSKGQFSFDFTSELDLKSFMRDKSDLSNLKESLENRNKIPRYRFDYVIGNPPYVSYNEISKQKLLFVQLMQDKKLQMNDIYGVNLNTVPGRIKAYSPKPNLYSFFIALGLALLKDGGKMCYIIPQTILTASDLDVLRFHLANFATIDKLINFSGKMFVGRGIKQNKPVPTSSLILIITKIPPNKLHETEIIYYKDSEDDVIDCLINIERGKKVSKVKILQNKLRQNIDNWNFIKSTKEETELIDEYHRNSESMDIYRDYGFSKKYFKDIFIIDGSYNIPTKKILTSQKNDIDYYDIPVFDNNFFSIPRFGFYPKNVEIKIAKGGQGLKVVATKHKVLWNYIKPQKFFFIGDNDNILPRFQQFCIGSNNKNEIVYLFSLLNSPITFFIFEKYLRSENEKDMLVGVKVIKEFIKVPKIADFNKHIKEEIITQTEKMLGMEKQTFGDLVDFKNVLMQKFDSAEMDSNHLILHYKDNSAKCKILSHPKLVEETIYNIEQGELFNKEETSITELKHSITYDKPLQQQIKNYIDDLVFALYFKIKLSELGFQNREAIKDACSKNKFYKLINA